MAGAREILVFVHVLGFAFMSVPLFNLIVVNERAALSKSFNYDADRYMENIIKNGAYRCFVFQSTVAVSGVALLITDSLGIDAIWTNWAVGAKVILLALLMGLLSHVHFSVQPAIEAIFSKLSPGSGLPDDLAGKLKRYRVRRKRLATLCLFLVISSIVLGLQVNGSFDPVVTAVLLILGAVFALKANKTLLRFGWI